MRLGAAFTGRAQFLGFSYGAKLVGTVLPSSKTVHVKLSEDSIFGFPYGDAYWGRLFDTSQTYEPDVQNFMKLVSGSDHAFIDCGANFGFMSIIASSAEGGSCPTLAIEADRSNFDRLCANRELNGNRFDVQHNALFSESGIDVSVFGTKHEAFSIVEKHGPSRGSVKTLAIGDLSDWLASTNRSRAMIKLDVEGAENAAIDGIGNLAGGDVILIYEDHGSDRQHSVTRHLQEKHGYRTFLFQNDKVTEVTDYADLGKIKVSRRYGYDFIATKSPYWLDRLERL